MRLLRLERLEEWIQARPALLAAGLACTVGALWAIVEALGMFLPARYSPYQVVWMRYATHLLILAAVWGPRRRSGMVKTPRWKGQILRGLLMLAMPATFILAVGSMDMHTVWGIFWLAPLAAMAGAVFLFREKGSITVWAAALLGLAGTLFILRPAHSGSWQQVLLALGMTACFILYVLATRYMAAENTLTSLFYTAFAVFLPLSIVIPQLWTPLTWKAAAVMAMIGLVGLALLFALDRALELAPITQVAPFFYSQAIWYLFFNRLLKRAPVSFLDVVGVLMVLVPVVVFMNFLYKHPRANLTVLAEGARG